MVVALYVPVSTTVRKSIAEKMSRTASIRRSCALNGPPNPLPTEGRRRSSVPAMDGGIERAMRPTIRSYSWGGDTPLIRANPTSLSAAGADASGQECGSSPVRRACGQGFGEISSVLFVSIGDEQPKRHWAARSAAAIHMRVALHARKDSVGPLDGHGLP